MFSLHSILAIQDLVNMLPKIFVGFALVMIVVAFAIGFWKGFRKVSWGGLTWFTAAGIFLLISRLIPQNGDVTKNFITALLISLVCIGGILAAYGALAYFVRPKVRWVKDNVNGDTSLAEYGLEFEPEYLDFDGEYDDWRPYGKRLHRTGFNPPNYFERILGGFTCVINVMTVIWAVAAFVVLAINATNMSNMNIGLVLQNNAVQRFVKLAKLTLMEGLTIGLVVLIAKKGYSAGLMNSVRGLIMVVCSVGATVICFYLPFSPFAENDSGLFYFLFKLVARCKNMFIGFGKFGNALGRIFAGGCMMLVAIVLLVLGNILLKKCCKLVSNTAPARTVDACLSCVFYLFVGAAVVAAIWFVLAGLDYFGILHISEFLSEDAHLSQGLFQFAHSKIHGVMAPYIN